MSTRKRAPDRVSQGSRIDKRRDIGYVFRFNSRRQRAKVAPGLIALRG
jgi:hypothetical protein